MKKISFLVVMAFIFSFKSTASTETIDQYMNDPDLLIGPKIVKINEAIKASASDAYKEKLERLSYNLTLVQKHSKDLAKKESLNELLALATKKGWKNVFAFAEQVGAICDNPEIPSDECLMGISNFKEMIQTRGITAEEKFTLTKMAQDYASFKEAKFILSDMFIEASNVLLSDMENATAEAKKLPPILIMKKKPDVVAKSATAVFNYADIIWGGALFLVLAFIIRLKQKNQKLVHDFYMDVLFVIKKCQTPGRLYGKMTKKKLLIFNQVEEPFFELLKGAKNLETQVDLYIRSKEKKLVMEAIIFLDRPIQETRELATHLANLEKALAKIGGELEYVNYFNQQGELANTGFILKS